LGLNAVPQSHPSSLSNPSEGIGYLRAATALRLLVTSAGPFGQVRVTANFANCCPLHGQKLSFQMRHRWKEPELLVDTCTLHVAQGLGLRKGPESTYFSSELGQIEAKDVL
jgi:hypothetical protein